MKLYISYNVVIFSIIFLLIVSSITPISKTQKVNQNYLPFLNIDDGQLLYSPLYSTNTYLINNNGVVNHSWSSTYTPGASVYWLGDGTILRTIRTKIGGAGTGGGVQKILWDGTIVWDFRYDSNGHLAHHDIKPLPNGNVLMIAWETKTKAEAITAGRNPSTITGDNIMPDHIIEVKPTGPTSGDIVWEWHVWDHLIQDYDSSKENYGVVRDHPELVDINFGTFFMSNNDWLHTNSIDYNPKFDQILLSVHSFNEIWVIDHSTTTEEAASHTGGYYGHGGDLLYRWGNPQAYQRGTPSDEKLFFQHGASWIKTGYPGEGNILVFNNGDNRPNGPYSSVDEFTPPVNSNGEYYLDPGSYYGPENITWSYTANPPDGFYSFYCGGAQRLKDGNTIICDGANGRFFEVTPEKDIVWQYVNPYPALNINDVFKIEYIPPEESKPDLKCEGKLSWTDIKPGATVYGDFQVENIGGAGSLLNWTINTSSINLGAWSFNPNSGVNLTPEEGRVTIQVSVIVPKEKEFKFSGFIRVENQNNSEDFNLIPVTLTTPRTRSSMSTLFLIIEERYTILQKLINRLEQ